MLPASQASGAGRAPHTAAYMAAPAVFARPHAQSATSRSVPLFREPPSAVLEPDASLSASMGLTSCSYGRVTAGTSLHRSGVDAAWPHGTSHHDAEALASSVLPGLRPGFTLALAASGSGRPPSWQPAAPRALMHHLSGGSTSRSRTFCSSRASSSASVSSSVSSSSASSSSSAGSGGSDRGASFASSSGSGSSGGSGGGSGGGDWGIRNVPWGFGGGSGGGSGGGGGAEGRGLPPPVIISPTALRVVVIGWMGSNRRYLNKYGALWARSGEHEVVMVRPSVAQTLVRWRGVVVAGRDIDRVARLHRENPAMPTVYHVFSTGGFIHAGTMWRWMDEVEDVAQRRDLLEEVRGIILDSAPASVHPDMASRAIVSALTNTPAEELTHGMPGWQGALLGGTQSFLERYLRSKGVQLRTEEVYDAWYNLAPVCPQLYLYSDADPLVPPADVERYMAVQEGRGVEVSSHKWADSGHVEHFRRHPHEYAYQISAFLARALKDW